LSSRSFLRFAAICAFGSALTTFGVHLLPLLHPANTFEQQLLLSQSPIYKLRLWIVLVHISFVLVSMWGFAAVKYKTDAGWIGLGLAGYALFGLAEFFRISFAMNAITPWRARMLTELDPQIRGDLREYLLSWPQINDALFFLLVVGFLVGNIFYAIATTKSRGLEKWISSLLFIWALLGSITLLHEFLNQRWLNFVPEFVSYTFQPFVRIVIGIWLWKETKI
jgi:hypothetical protein